MSDVIKLYIKQEGPFHLDKIETDDENNLYQNDGSAPVSLGESSCEFTIEVYLEDDNGQPFLIHSEPVSQPQNEPADDIKPGKLPGSNRLF